MPLLLSVVVLTQQWYAAKPDEVSTVRPGEVVRLFKRGGLTPKGLYFSLVTVTSNHKVFIKDRDGNFSAKLSDASHQKLYQALQLTNWDVLRANRRQESYPPSAHDATDIYLSARVSSGIQRWNNVQWHEPEDFQLKLVLDEITQEAKKKSLKKAAGGNLTL